MGILNFLKELLLSIIYPKALIKDVTKENIEKLEIKLRPNEYKRWVRKKLVFLTHVIELRKERGIIVPPELLLKKKLLEEKFEKIER